MQISTESAVCNLCGGRSAELVEKHASCSVVACLQCGLVFLTPLPEVHDLLEHYDGDYFKPWIHEQQAQRRTLWAKRLNLVSRYRSSKGGLLDVGCGDGSFLRLAKEEGWLVAGTEMSAWACDFVGKNVGVSVRHGDLASMSEINGAPFDVITMWHVLEHMPDPLGNLRRAVSFLKDDGCLIVEVPNVNDFLFRAAYLVAKQRRLQLYSEGERELHLFHFSGATLSAMLRKAGLQVLKIGNGVDSQIEPVKRALDCVARVCSVIPGVGIGTTIMAVCTKSKERAGEGAAS